MKAIAEFLRAPFSSRFSAVFWVMFVIAWKPAIMLAVRLSHTSWREALASFGFTP